MNNVPFKINKAVLRFVMKEWDKDENIRNTKETFYQLTGRKIL